MSRGKRRRKHAAKVRAGCATIGPDALIRSADNGPVYVVVRRIGWRRAVMQGPDGTYWKGSLRRAVVGELRGEVIIDRRNHLERQIDGWVDCLNTIANAMVLVWGW